MELTVVLIAAAFASARWATLITNDDFGPIRDAVDWVKYRWPDADDAYYESEVVGNEGVGWQVRDSGLDVFPDVDPGGIRVFYPVDPHPLGTLLSCVRCVSVWTGLAAAAIGLLTPSWAALPVLLPFAFSQITITLTGSD